MKDVILGYKAYDLHELTCHFVALHAGLYAERGLNVRLLDTRTVPDDELSDSVMSVACGSALLRWLRGAPVKVVCVAAMRPMFWLHCRERVQDLRDLRGECIAGYPLSAPPAQFLRVVLDEAGLGSAGAVSVVPLPDDGARLAMLQSGEAAAAVLSSAATGRAAGQAGWRRLLCLGDRIRLPTTGLAVHARLLTDDPGCVAGMREAFAAALRVIHGDEAVLRKSLRAASLADDPAACSMVREFYSRDGEALAADVRPEVQRLARSMGTALPADVGELYATGLSSPRVQDARDC